jgi:hypothetical protein
MRKVLFALALLLTGCQYDPHADLYTTNEPNTDDIAGTYVLDKFDLPMDSSKAPHDVEIEIRRDGTFTATNIPPWKMGEASTNFFSQLLSGDGKWEKDTVGTRSDSKRIWGIDLRTPDNRFAPAALTGEKPPYGLIFTLGDPDSGQAVLLRKRQ